MKKEFEKMLDLAYELCQEGQFEKAIRYYDLVLKEEPENIVASIDKGVALQNLGNLKEALYLFQTVLKKNPKKCRCLGKQRLCITHS